jgi:hypothetical protein
MATESIPSLQAIDVSVLRHVVRRALQQDTAELLTRQGTPIAYDMYLPGRLVARFGGLATVENVSVPWSVVLKQTWAPEAEREPRAESWRRASRELHAYRSGLLDSIPGSLRAPRALAATNGEDGTIALWLEDVSEDIGPDWPLDQYGRAARHLGQFNGAYLAEHPLPSFPWLSPSWAELHSAVTEIPEALPRITALASVARVQHAFPVPIRDLAPRLLNDAPMFIRLLSRLPQTLCHHDASRANLFARRDTAGTLETIAIDWELLGPGALGAEIAPLVFGTIRRGDFSATHVADLDREVFGNYVLGLRDAGWRGDEELVRLGYTAAVALRWFQLDGTLRALTDDAAAARRGRAPSESDSRALDEFIQLSLYLLARADEARGLSRYHALGSNRG